MHPVREREFIVMDGCVLMNKNPEMYFSITITERGTETDKQSVKLISFYFMSLYSKAILDNNNNKIIYPQDYEQSV